MLSKRITNYCNYGYELNTISLESKNAQFYGNAGFVAAISLPIITKTLRIREAKN